MTIIAQAKIAASTANIFDRTSLQFTVKLLRNQNPSLALRIQNIIAPVMVPAPATVAAPSLTDTFDLDLALDSFTIKRVVETLAIAGHALATEVLETGAGDHEQLLLTKEIISKWLLFARHHQDETERVSCDIG